MHEKKRKSAWLKAWDCFDFWRVVVPSSDKNCKVKRNKNLIEDAEKNKWKPAAIRLFFVWILCYKASEVYLERNEKRKKNQ